MQKKLQIPYYILTILLMYAAVQIINLDYLSFLMGVQVPGGGGVLDAIQAENLQLLDIAAAALPFTSTANLLMLGLALFVYTTPKLKLARWEQAFSFLCAAVWLIGYSFTMTNDWQLLYGTPLSLLCSGLVVSGGGLLLQHLMRWGKTGAKKLQTVTVPEHWSNHQFKKAWAFLLVCWLPWIIARFPAGIQYDAYHQMLQFLGVKKLTTHWPLFSTILMGSFAQLGQLLGSYNLGVFLFVVCQVLVCSAIFAYTLVFMRKINVRPVWRVVAVFVYGFAAIYPNFLTAMTKDALFSAFTVLFVTLLAEYLLLPDSRTLRHHLRFGLVALLMCMLRNNGVYLVLFCMAIMGLSLIVYRKKLHLILVGVLAAVVILHSGWNNLASAAGIPSGSKAEALSIPFQQTARYVRDYPEDVTPEEAEAIRAVIDYDNLAELYDPNLSDPVKGSYNENDEALGDYLAVWFKQFLRHPMVYVEATLNNTAGFYYPFVHNYVCYTNPESAEGFRFNENLQFQYPEALTPFRTLLKAYVYIFESTPLLMLLGATGFHTWIVLYLACSLLAKKDWRKLYILVPALVSILVCIASPTFTYNGVRYALPYIYSMPLLLGITTFRKHPTE